MTIKSALASYLKSKPELVALVSDRIWPVALPQKKPRPAITYRRLPSGHDHTLTSSAGTSLATFRIASYGDSYEDADLVAEAVRSVMQGFSGVFVSTKVNSVVLGDESDDFFEPQDGSSLGVYVVNLDFRIRYAESIPQFN